MRITEKDFQDAALYLNVDVAAIKAVKEVESGGRGGFLKEGKPIILFEGHIFWRELKKRGLLPEQFVDGNEDILHPKWSKIHYKGGIQEYERLEKAKMIHEEAALASASWGMFQIMGFDFALCGEKSVREMVDRMTESEACQLKLFLIFLEKNKWVNYLRNKDWARFARCYNGPGYAINQYDRKLQMAYEKYSKKSVC